MSNTSNETPRERGRLSRLASHPAVQGLLVLAIAAVGIAIGLAWQTVRHRRPRPPVRSPLPEANPIWDSWRAAEAGDVDAYLACFTGSAREKAEAELKRVGREAFRRQLQATAAAARTIEVRPPREESDGSLVFPVTARRAEDKELFDYLVAREQGKWRIREVTPIPAKREGGS